MVSATLAIAIIGTIALWATAAFVADATPATWVLVTAVVYAIIAAGCLGLVLLAHAAAARTVALLRWPFVLGVLTYLVVSVSRGVVARLSGSDTVHLQVMNDSGELIQWVDVFGRGDKVRIDSIPSGSSAVASFRGRENDYGTRDPHSNRIAVRWYAGGQRRERIVVGEWVVIGDSMVIVFPTPDSIVAR